MRVTSFAFSEPAWSCGSKGDKLSPPDAKRKRRRFILVLPGFRRRAPSAVQLRELLAQPSNLRSVVDHNVEIVRMMNGVILVVRFRGIKDIQLLNLRNDRL